MINHLRTKHIKELYKVFDTDYNVLYTKQRQSQQGAITGISYSIMITCYFSDYDYKKKIKAID